MRRSKEGEPPTDPPVETPADARRVRACPRDEVGSSPKKQAAVETSPSDTAPVSLWDGAFMRWHMAPIRLPQKNEIR